MDGARLYTPDQVLLRRFGLVRGVGGVTYTVMVVVLFAVVGTRVWPLALGVPVLIAATLAYRAQSSRFPRAAVASTLAADALVLGGAIAFLGGAGSGLVLLYTIVVVSAGILLGPSAAAEFTLLCVLLGVVQLLAEQAGLRPALVGGNDAGERVPILIVSLAGVASVGYLSAIYADRLHELIADAGVAAEHVRARGRSRRWFVGRATTDVAEPLAQLQALADSLADKDPQIAARLRSGVARLRADVSLLADVGVMDAAEEARPQPLSLQQVVADALAALGDRVAPFHVQRDLAPIKVLGDPQAARRVVFNLLENVIEHTPPGTTVTLRARHVAGRGVLVVADDGPGLDPAAVRSVFEPPGQGRGARVGLPLVRALCDAMGAQVTAESASGGGARFVVSFRLAPTGAPGPDDAPVAVG